MNLVTIEGLSKRYAERTLLDGVDLRVNAGERIGLIGINGSGKSTLLKIVAGLEPPDAGNVTVWGGVRVRYLSQLPELDPEQRVLEAMYASEAPRLKLLARYHGLQQAIEAQPDDVDLQDALAAILDEIERDGAWAAEAEAKAVLSRLGIEAFEARVGQLSGGQQKRVALAQALVDPGDLLILDEPTNHVDAETIAWLESALAKLDAALLLVTHDRYFLDRVVTRIIELDRRELVSYPGNYSRYLEQRQARHDRLSKAEADRQRQIKQELDWLRRGAKARSTKQKARRDRAEELMRLSFDKGEAPIAISLAGRRLGKRVLSAEGIERHYGDNAVLRDLELRVEPGERIGIVGPNGAGKSSLLDILAGRHAPDAGAVSLGETVKLGYFDQASAPLDEGMRVLDYVEQEATLIRTEDGFRVSAALALEWLRFPKPHQGSYIGSLSGGERRRLHLLCVLLHRPNLLLLDEPTNDLDIETLGVLEDFIAHYQGSLIVASHDRYFLDRCVDQIAVLEDGKLSTGYPVPFEAFLRLRESEAREQQSPDEDEAAQTARARDAVSTSPAAPEPSAAEARAKLSWKEARELEDLEARIESLESKRDQLEQDLAAAGEDYQRVTEIAEALEALGQQMSQFETRWLELSERA